MRLSLTAFACSLVLLACSSSDSDPAPAASSSSSGGSSGTTSSGGGAACPSLAGAWKVASHCDASLVGKDAPVTQDGEKLTFGGLFTSFTGTVTSDCKVTISGPQQCTGTATTSSITMTCTPGTCAVTLTK